MAVIIPAAIAPKLAAALDVPVSMIGFQVSFAYVGATLMSLAAGLVVRRMGALRTNQIAAFLVTASLLAISVPHIAALLCWDVRHRCRLWLDQPGRIHIDDEDRVAGQQKPDFFDQAGQVSPWAVLSQD